MRFAAVLLPPLSHVAGALEEFAAETSGTVEEEEEEEARLVYLLNDELGGADCVVVAVVVEVAFADVVIVFVIALL